MSENQTIKVQGGASALTDGRVLSFRPEPGFYHKRAEKSIEKGDYTAALKNLRRAVQMEPDDLSLRLDIADTYARMGLYERSNLEIQLMFHLPKLPTEAIFGMASNFMAMGDYDQAEAMYRAYEQVEPEGEFADQADDALAYIAECDYETELDRELDELSMDGKAALDAGDLEHAVDCLERALAKDPSMTYVRNNLAVAYYCLGDMDKAWKHIRQVLRQEPLDVHGRCNESMLYLAENKQAEAVEAVRRLRLDRIEEVDDLFKYCLALADAGLDEELMQALKKIFLSCPYDVSMLYLYGACQYNLGRYQESLLTFEKLCLTEPDSLLAAWGMKQAAAAVRDGAPPIDRISYSYELPGELKEQLRRCLDDLTGRKPEEVKQALKDEDIRRLVRGAAFFGTEGQMSHAVLLLSYAVGPDAERLLRELLLSPTLNSYFKQMVVEALRAIHAPEPYYGLQDGRLVLIGTKKLKLDELVPEGYLNVMRGAVEHLQNDKQALEFAVGAWSAYMFSVQDAYPRITHEAAWVRALEAMYRISRGEEPDWQRLADEAGVTVRTLRVRVKKLTQARDSLGTGEENGGN